MNCHSTVKGFGYANIRMISFCTNWWMSHPVYAPCLLSPFLCWWTLRLLLCLCCCEECFDAPWGARVFSNCGFLQVYAPAAGPQDRTIPLSPVFLRTFHTVFHNTCTSTDSHENCRGLLFLHELQTFNVCRVFDNGSSGRWEMIYLL